MKILVTGYGGQLGYDVVEEGRKHGLEMIGIDVQELDITKQDEVYSFVKEVRPDAIIHCAAYTTVDKAEDEQALAWAINVDGTKYLVEVAKEIHAKFIYISTDYIFDGEGTTPFREGDTARPINYYGKTKYEGEKIVQDLLQEYFIVRISWVFGINGNNFIKTMLQLAESKSELNIVADQIGSPTYTFDLAKLLINMIQTNKYGIYHASNEGFCSWADFAKEIFTLGKKDVIVHGITTEQYPTRATRPRNSRMSKDKLQQNGFHPLRSWQEATAHYIEQLEVK